MMGVAVDSLEYPILKGTGGVLFLTEQAADLAPEATCIKCARCVDSCPMNLMPLEYVRRIQKDSCEDLDELHLNDCTECGCCAYVCPARIPLVHYIKFGKERLRQLQVKK